MAEKREVERQWRERGGEGGIERETDRQTQREAGRQTDTGRETLDRDRHTDRDRQNQRHIERSGGGGGGEEVETDRINRETDRQTDREPWVDLLGVNARGLRYLLPSGEQVVGISPLAMWVLLHPLAVLTSGLQVDLFTCSFVKPFARVSSLAAEHVAMEGKPLRGDCNRSVSSLQMENGTLTVKERLTLKIWFYALYFIWEQLGRFPAVCQRSLSLSLSLSLMLSKGKKVRGAENDGGGRGQRERKRERERERERERQAERQRELVVHTVWQLKGLCV